MNGPTGLDYNVLTPMLRLLAIPKKEWPDVFDDIRTLEDAALAQMQNVQK